MLVHFVSGSSTIVPTSTVINEFAKAVNRRIVMTFRRGEIGDVKVFRAFHNYMPLETGHLQLSDHIVGGFGVLAELGR
jgi:hypothetical protein